MDAIQARVRVVQLRSGRRRCAPAPSTEPDPHGGPEAGIGISGYWSLNSWGQSAALGDELKVGKDKCRSRGKITVADHLVNYHHRLDFSAGERDRLFLQWATLWHSGRFVAGGVLSTLLRLLRPRG